MRKVALNRVSRHDVFNMKFIQIHGGNSRNFCEEKMRICLWSYKFFYCFDATHKMGSIGYACFSLRRMHLESRMFAGETWNSLEYDDAWLCLFSSRRMLFCPWGPEMVQEKYEMIRNMMHL